VNITSCPGCGAPAEITERFTLASTDGPVAHVAVCCAGGHHYRMAADRLPADRSRPPAPRLRATLGPGRPPHTFLLCIHCLVNPAGFWVSSAGSSVARRPWCLSCCQDLDRQRCDMIPFGG
jgi:hypothetical protein